MCFARYFCSSSSSSSLSDFHLYLMVHIATLCYAPFQSILHVFLSHRVYSALKHPLPHDICFVMSSDRCIHVHFVQGDHYMYLCVVLYVCVMWGRVHQKQCVFQAFGLPPLLLVLFICMCSWLFSTYSSVLDLASRVHSFTCSFLTGSIHALCLHGQL